MRAPVGVDDVALDVRDQHGVVLAIENLPEKGTRTRPAGDRWWCAWRGGRGRRRHWRRRCIQRRFRFLISGFQFRDDIRLCRVRHGGSCTAGSCCLFKPESHGMNEAVRLCEINYAKKKLV